MCTWNIANSISGKQAASISGLKIVSWNWLLDSATDGKPASESSYLLAATSAPAPATNGRPLRSSRTKQQSNDTTANASLDDDNDKPATSSNDSKGKKQAAKSKAKRPLATDDDENTTTSKSQGEPPAKKQKDAQKASSPTLKVPVDEKFSFAGKYRSNQGNKPILMKVAD